MPTGSSVATLSMIAAAISTYRGFRTDNFVFAAAAIVAALLALAAARLARGHGRTPLAPLATALGMEFTVLWSAAPPRLVNALPLIFAIAITATTTNSSPPAQRPDHPRAWFITSAISLALLAPIGLMFLSIGLIANAPDIYVSYALYIGIVGVAVVLAHRRSWGVAAVPPAAVVVFILMIQLGVALRGWSG